MWPAITTTSAWSFVSRISMAEHAWKRVSGMKGRKGLEDAPKKPDPRPSLFLTSTPAVFSGREVVPASQLPPTFNLYKSIISKYY